MTRAQGRSRGALFFAFASVACLPKPGNAPAEPRWCELLPRPGNAALERVSVRSDWFEVYRVADGVFALVEPRQFQETISYLVVGSDRALLFDTGLGLFPIRPVVEELTRKPVEVLNSHTHFDHVGGNAEFDRILVVESAYTRANARGFAHHELAGEMAPEAFCGGAPPGADTEGFQTKPWTATRTVGDGDRIDLGGTVLEILRVPGHTPDAVALLDGTRGFLWTGDTFLEDAIWLFVPETDLDDYERSLGRLAGLPGLQKLLPAHGAATAAPKRLKNLRAAVRQVREGSARGKEEPGENMSFPVDGFSILVGKRQLEGQKPEKDRGGSGLAILK